MTKRVRQIAKLTEQKLSDSAKFSKVKNKTILSAIQRWPRNFKDYVPKYLQIHSMTLVAPRAMTAPVQFGNESTLVHLMLTDLGFAFLGNWLGIPTAGAVTRATYDTVKSGILEIIGTGGRQSITYYPSHQDEAIVWDTNAVEQNISDQGVNPQLLQLACAAHTPLQVLDDVLLDVHMTRWGFLRALTHRELMLSNPVYRQEQNQRVAKLPSCFAESLGEEKRKQKSKKKTYILSRPQVLSRRMMSLCEERGRCNVVISNCDLL